MLRALRNTGNLGGSAVLLNRSVGSEKGSKGGLDVSNSSSSVVFAHLKMSFLSELLQLID